MACVVQTLGLCEDQCVDVWKTPHCVKSFLFIRPKITRFRQRASRSISVYLEIQFCVCFIYKPI